MFVAQRQFITTCIDVKIKIGNRSSNPAPQREFCIFGVRMGRDRGDFSVLGDAAVLTADAPVDTTSYLFLPHLARRARLTTPETLHPQP